MTAQSYDGATKLIERTHSRTDKLNLTNIWDNVTAANNQVFGHSAANRLNSASGPYGAQSWIYDGVGNRTSQTIAAATTAFNYPVNSNKLSSLSGATTRAITYDNAGNIATDSRSGGPWAYTYNKANRLKTVSASATVRGTYTYNGFDQLIARVITNSGVANGSTYFVHDL
jgi:YD repeat-containing protein